MSIWWQKTLTCPLCLLYCPFGLAGIKWLISYFPILVWHGITQYWCNRKSWKLDSYWSYDHYWNMVTWFSYVHFFSFPILLWMPVEDYATQPFNQKQELFNYVAKICLSKSEKNYAGFSPLATATGSGKTSYSTSIIKEWNTLSLHNQM